MGLNSEEKHFAQCVNLFASQKSLDEQAKWQDARWVEIRDALKEIHEELKESRKDFRYALTGLESRVSVLEKVKDKVFVYASVAGATVMFVYEVIKTGLHSLKG